MMEDSELQTIVETILDVVDERLAKQAEEYQSQLDSVRTALLERFKHMLAELPTEAATPELWWSIGELEDELQKLADHTGYVRPDLNAPLLERIRLIPAGAAKPEPILTPNEQAMREAKERTAISSLRPASSPGNMLEGK
jgi:hypothetical protein